MAYGAKLLAAAAIMLLAGCEAMPDLASRAVDFNEAAATAANQQILLNAVRAYKREPLFYTRITGITTKRNASPALALSVPFGADARQIFNAAATGGVSNETLFSTEILDAQDFYNGIMQPLSAEMLKFYLDGGWPQEMIYHLFVERFELSGAMLDDVVAASQAACDGKKAPAILCADGGVLQGVARNGGHVLIDNDPRHGETFRQFQAFLRRLEALNFGMSVKAVERSVVYPKPVIASLDQLLKVSNARMETAGDGIKVTFSERKTVFSFPDHAFNAEVKGGDNGNGIVVVTRSSDAALYYLGELVAAQLEAKGDADLMPAILTGFPDPKPAALFAIEARGLTDTPLSVDHEGDTYAVQPAAWPAGGKLHGHRTMQVIALMNQVFALNKKGSLAPSVVPVTVLN